MAFDTFPCNPYPISKGMLEKGNNDELNTRVTALEGEVSDLNDTKANQITIAPFFSAEASYEVGDLVYYNGLTYRCTNDHEGDWDADDFASTTVAGELATLKSGLTSVNNKFTTPQSLPNAGVLTDANDVSKTCISVVNSLTANLPSGIVVSCPMITLMGSADLGWGAYDMGIQILITNSGQANGNYCRVKYTDNWYPWGNF